MKMFAGDTISFIGQVRRRLFGMSSAEASFARRGFHTGEPAARGHLELIGKTFLEGYRAALEEVDFEMVTLRLEAVTAELRGFAFEGAAMALGLLDRLMPWRADRWRRFTERFAQRHTYMMHVGLGWALARLRRRVAPPLKRLDPLLGWLVVDGYGFHEGYFRWRSLVERREAPALLDGYARRVFDQGLGRSIWFVKGADVTAIESAICGFHPSRRGDLWSGIGLACAYAGGVGRDEIERLRSAAGDYGPQLAQGAAFAAKTRQRAANAAAHTETACLILCGRSAAAAAAVTDVALEDLRGSEALPAYEVWRRRIQAELIGEAVGAS